MARTHHVSHTIHDIIQTWFYDRLILKQTTRKHTHTHTTNAYARALTHQTHRTHMHACVHRLWQIITFIHINQHASYSRDLFFFQLLKTLTLLTYHRIHCADSSKQAFELELPIHKQVTLKRGKWDRHFLWHRSGFADVPLSWCFCCLAGGAT